MQDKRILKPPDESNFGPWERHSCRDSDDIPTGRSGQECPSHGSRWDLTEAPLLASGIRGRF
jgi:hypothetical protein